MKKIFYRLIKRSRVDFDTKYSKKVFDYLNLYKNGKEKLAIKKYNIVRRNTSCDISYKAFIQDGFYIAHMDGILIGETSVIEKGVVCFPNVHIISNVLHNLDDNNVLLSKRHAVIGEYTMLCDGCIIIGPITIGKNCIIAAGAIVTKDIPDNSVVKGVNDVSVNGLNNKVFYKNYRFGEGKIFNRIVWNEE